MSAAVCDVVVRPSVPAEWRVNPGRAALPRRPMRRPDACRPIPDVDGGHAPEPWQAAASCRAAIIRILLADDHAIVRESLARLLQMQEGMQVVGVASDGQEAVDLALATRPDVIVMDVTMPRLNGIQATRRIKAALPDVCVIGLSMHAAADMAADMRLAGASHYLVKTSAPAELIHLIRGCSRRSD